jgi:peptidoglycan/LPS O-acetylase OafA/YrhL
MSVYSVWPYFLVVGLACAVVNTRLFKSLDQPPSSGRARSTSVDGIRGFLALSVMIDHAVVTHRWLMTGEWIVPPGKFYDQLGTLSVAVFFMITGFLFWGRMFRAHGKIDFLSLYINRLFRIAPVYLLAISLMVLIVFARTDFVLRQPIPDLLSAIGEWAALGLLQWPDFNGYGGAALILAGVTWSLKWEWYFYFSLLITGWFADRAAVWLPAMVLPASLAAAHFWPAHQWYFATLFACGMLVSAFQDSPLPSWLPNERLRSAISVLLLVAIFVGWSTPWVRYRSCWRAAFFTSCAPELVSSDC